jgi:hypothetical protein
MLRDIHTPPVAYDQLTRNIQMMMDKMKKYGTGVKPSYCLSWIDEFSSCHESNDDTTVESPPKIATKVMRGDTGKLVTFH